MGVREDLVDVGARLLEAEGLSALTLRGIAAEAGVSHGAPRHHFPTYGALLGAIARSGVDDVNALLTPCFAMPDPRDSLLAAARTYVRFARERPEMFELIARHDLLDGQGGRLREITGAWFENLARQVARASGHSDRVAATALWSGVHGTAVLFSRRTVEPVQAERDVCAVLERLVDALVPSGIEAAPHVDPAQPPSRRDESLI